MACWALSRIIRRGVGDRVWGWEAGGRVVGRDQSWSDLAHWAPNWSMRAWETRSPGGSVSLCSARLWECFPQTHCFSCLCSLTWGSLQLSSVKRGGGERAGGFISCCSQAAVCTLLRKGVCHRILFTSHFSLQHCLFSSAAVFLWKFIFKTTNKIAFSCFRKSAFR